MIAKCANPDCNVAFRYLRGGKLFLLDIPAGRGAKETTAAVWNTFGSATDVPPR